MQLEWQAVLTMALSVDPDQTDPTDQTAQSDLGLHCLP